MLLKEYIDTHFDETLEGIAKIIKIKTVKANSIGDAPFGENLKFALKEILKIAENLGFKTKNLDNYIGYAEIGEGEDYIGILGHIDVVPEGDTRNWSVPPYSATIQDGLLISRGALDNKGPIISALYAIKALTETNPNFKKRVRIIFGTNEESGDEDIKHYLKYEKPPKYAFTPDGRFPVIFSEKGIYTFSYLFDFDPNKTKIVELNSGTKSNIIPERAEIVLRDVEEQKIKEDVSNIENKSKCKFNIVKLENGNIKVEIKGKSGHASHPEKGINSILGMYVLLDNILTTEDDLKEFVSFINLNVGETTDGRFLGIECKNEEMGDLTISAGISKIIDNQIYIKFNIRYPATTSKEELDKKLFAKRVGSKIIFRSENNNNPLYFPKNSILVETLQRVYKNITGRDEEPAALGGGTYAKLMPNTVAFGPNYKEFNGNPHGFDECIEIKMLKEGMEIYARAVLELSRYL